MYVEREDENTLRDSKEMCEMELQAPEILSYFHYLLNILRIKQKTTAGFESFYYFIPTIVEKRFYS